MLAKRLVGDEAARRRDQAIRRPHRKLRTKQLLPGTFGQLLETRCFDLCLRQVIQLWERSASVETDSASERRDGTWCVTRKRVARDLETVLEFPRVRHRVEAIAVDRGGDREAACAQTEHVGRDRVPRGRRRFITPGRRLERVQGHGLAAAEGEPRQYAALLPPPACDHLRPVPNLERPENTDPHSAIVRWPAAKRE